MSASLSSCLDTVSRRRDHSEGRTACLDSVSMPSRAYARRRSAPAAPTRDRIMAAVRELLAEGTFHETPVETVAERAGVSRATLYQHFRSRVDLVDAICDSFAVNPALR